MALLESIVAKGFSDEACVNDLEPPAFAHLPELKKLKVGGTVSRAGGPSLFFRGVGPSRTCWS